MAEKSLFERLGGTFPIAAVVDHFSDQLMNNSTVGKRSKNPALREWHSTEYASRLQGLKFLRTLWLCAASGGPFEYTGKSLGQAHHDFHIAAEEFDEVAAELGRSLDHFKVPKREKEEVLAAFRAQKHDVTGAAKANAK
jgi:hemoglobin